MAKNKQSIQQAEMRQRKLVLRIARDANELSDLNAKITKMRSGKIKVPPPPGIKVKIESKREDDFGDVLPAFLRTE